MRVPGVPYGSSKLLLLLLLLSALLLLLPALLLLLCRSWQVEPPNDSVKAVTTVSRSWPRLLAHLHSSTASTTQLHWQSTICVPPQLD